MRLPRPGASALVGLLMLGLGLATFQALRRLGYGPAVALALIGAIGAGASIDLPLYRRRARIGLNVGGGLVPLAVATAQVAGMPAAAWGPLAAATATVALAAFLLKRPVEGVGVLLPWMLPALLGAALALVLAPARAAGVAYVAGTVGPLVGADLPTLGRLGPVRAAVGGGGLFDGLLWSGVLAACVV